MWGPLKASKGWGLEEFQEKPGNLMMQRPILTGWNLRSGLRSKDWMSSKVGEASRWSTTEASIPFCRGPPRGKLGRPRGPEIYLQENTLSKGGRREGNRFVTKIFGEWLELVEKGDFLNPFL